MFFLIESNGNIAIWCRELVYSKYVFFSSRILWWNESIHCHEMAGSTLIIFWLDFLMKLTGLVPWTGWLAMNALLNQLINDVDEFVPWSHRLKLMIYLVYSSMARNSLLPWARRLEMDDLFNRILNEANQLVPWARRLDSKWMVFRMESYMCETDHFDAMSSSDRNVRFSQTKIINAMDQFGAMNSPAKHVCVS